jgi:hypothetical protein
MAKNIKQIADSLGAKVVGRVPDTGGSAFGAAPMAGIVANVQAHLVPGQGKRAGRPSDPSWVSHPKVPMSEATGGGSDCWRSGPAPVGARPAQCRSRRESVRTG